MIASTVERPEEREALDMIPVGVRDEEVRGPLAGLELLTHQVFAQPTYAGARVDDHPRTGIRLDLDARRVPAVALGLAAGDRKRPADAPESDPHGSAKDRVEIGLAQRRRDDMVASISHAATGSRRPPR